MIYYGYGSEDGAVRWFRPGVRLFRRRCLGALLAEQLFLWETTICVDTSAPCIRRHGGGRSAARKEQRNAEETAQNARRIAEKIARRRRKYHSAEGKKNRGRNSAARKEQRSGEEIAQRREGEA